MPIPFVIDNREHTLAAVLNDILGCSRPTDRRERFGWLPAPQPPVPTSTRSCAVAVTPFLAVRDTVTM